MIITEKDYENTKISLDIIFKILTLKSIFIDF